MWMLLWIAIAPFLVHSFSPLSIHHRHRTPWDWGLTPVQSPVQSVPRSQTVFRGRTVSYAFRSRGVSFRDPWNVDEDVGEFQLRKKLQFLISQMNDAMQAKPRRAHVCDRAAGALEAHAYPPAQNSTTDHAKLSPKEWTLLISCWGGAGRPSKALAALRRAERVMAWAESKKNSTAVGGLNTSTPSALSANATSALHRHNDNSAVETVESATAAAVIGRRADGSVNKMTTRTMATTSPPLPPVGAANNNSSGRPRGDVGGSGRALLGPPTFRPKAPPEFRPKALYGAAIGACCTAGGESCGEVPRLMEAMRGRKAPPDEREWGAFLTSLTARGEFSAAERFLNQAVELGELDRHHNVAFAVRVEVALKKSAHEEQGQQEEEGASTTTTTTRSSSSSSSRQRRLNAALDVIDAALHHYRRQKQLHQWGKKRHKQQISGDQQGWRERSEPTVSSSAGGGYGSEGGGEQQPQPQRRDIGVDNQDDGGSDHSPPAPARLVLPRRLRTGLLLEALLVALPPGLDLHGDGENGSDGDEGSSSGSGSGVGWRLPVGSTLAFNAVSLVPRLFSDPVTRPDKQGVLAALAACSKGHRPAAGASAQQQQQRTAAAVDSVPRWRHALLLLDHLLVRSGAGGGVGGVSSAGGSGRSSSTATVNSPASTWRQPSPSPMAAVTLEEVSPVLSALARAREWNRLTALFDFAVETGIFPASASATATPATTPTTVATSPRSSSLRSAKISVQCALRAATATQDWRRALDLWRRFVASPLPARAFTASQPSFPPSSSSRERGRPQQQQQQQRHGGSRSYQGNSYTKDGHLVMLVDARIVTAAVEALSCAPFPPPPLAAAAADTAASDLSSVDTLSLHTTSVGADAQPPPQPSLVRQQQAAASAAAAAAARSSPPSTDSSPTPPPPAPLLSLAHQALLEGTEYYSSATSPQSPQQQHVRQRQQQQQRQRSRGGGDGSDHFNCWNEESCRAVVRSYCANAAESGKASRGGSGSDDDVEREGSSSSDSSSSGGVDSGDDEEVGFESASMRAHGILALLKGMKSKGVTFGSSSSSGGGVRSGSSQEGSQRASVLLPVLGETEKAVRDAIVVACLAQYQFTRQQQPGGGQREKAQQPSSQPPPPLLEDMIAALAAVVAPPPSFSPTQKLSDTTTVAYPSPSLSSSSEAPSPPPWLPGNLHVLGLALRACRQARRASATLPLLELIRSEFGLAVDAGGGGGGGGVADKRVGSAVRIEEARGDASKTATAAGATTPKTPPPPTPATGLGIPAWVHMEAVQCYLDAGLPSFAVAWLCSLPRRGVEAGGEGGGGGGGGGALLARGGPTREVYSNVMRACIRASGGSRGSSRFSSSRQPPPFRQDGVEKRGEVAAAAEAAGEKEEGLEEGLERIFQEEMLQEEEEAEEEGRRLQLSEAVLVLMAEQKARGLEPDGSSCLSYLEACQRQQLWRASLTTLLKDMAWDGFKFVITASMPTPSSGSPSSSASPSSSSLYPSPSPSSETQSSSGRSSSGSRAAKAVATPEHCLVVLRTLQACGQWSLCGDLVREMAARRQRRRPLPLAENDTYGGGSVGRAGGDGDVGGSDRSLSASSSASSASWSRSAWSRCFLVALAAAADAGDLSAVERIALRDMPSALVMTTTKTTTTQQQQQGMSSLFFYFSSSEHQQQPAIDGDDGDDDDVSITGGTAGASGGDHSAEDADMLSVSRAVLRLRLKAATAYVHSSEDQTAASEAAALSFVRRLVADARAASDAAAAAAAAAAANAGASVENGDKGTKSNLWRLMTLESYRTAASAVCRPRRQGGEVGDKKEEQSSRRVQRKQQQRRQQQEEEERGEVCGAAVELLGLAAQDGVSADGVLCNSVLQAMANAKASAEAWLLLRCMLGDNSKFNNGDGGDSLSLPMSSSSPQPRLGALLTTLTTAHKSKRLAFVPSKESSLRRRQGQVATGASFSFALAACTEAAAAFTALENDDNCDNDNHANGAVAMNHDLNDEAANSGVKRKYRKKGGEGEGEVMGDERPQPRTRKGFTPTTIAGLPLASFQSERGELVAEAWQCAHEVEKLLLEFVTATATTTHAYDGDAYEDGKSGNRFVHGKRTSGHVSGGNRQKQTMRDDGSGGDAEGSVSYSLDRRRGNGDHDNTVAQFLTPRGRKALNDLSRHRERERNS